MILAIDTSGPVVGICLAGLGVEPQSWSARAGRGADAVLVPAIADLLSGAPAPLTGVALTTGPGAFTGLRVGLAIGTGIALARNVLVLPMGSLAARALLALDAPEVLAVLDARKGRVYARRFRSTPRALNRSGMLKMLICTMFSRWLALAVWPWGRARVSTPRPWPLRAWRSSQVPTPRQPRCWPSMP